MRIPQSPPPWAELLAGLSEPKRFIAIFSAVAGTTHDGKYLHWDELRFRTPPAGLSSHKEWWLGLKFRRQATYRAISLADKDDHKFSFAVPDLVTDLIHQIDRGGGTMVDIPEAVTSPEQRDRYVVRSLMEEAITSSQLEGAATTREVAKKMLAEGRAPRDNSERMILNNYRTIQKVRELKANALTPDLILELHRLVSEGTLEKADAAGRFRKADETIDISNQWTGQVFHVPPPASQLPDRVKEMCRFANGETPDFFVHPVIRAIILHFWLAYDHPFVDGNGRTARALFYWQMLRQGYWLFEFISISQILRKAPAQYGTAFLHTETDENDLTYFIIHQAGVIQRAVRELHDYVARKSSETRVCLEMLQKRPELNHRQQALMAHALKHPGFAYNIDGHASRHAVVYQTARTDLLELTAMNLLEQKKSGRAFVFIAPSDLQKRLQRSAK